VPLLAVATRLPVVVQFLALPVGVSVLVAYRPTDRDNLRVSPHVFADGDELAPAPGSYVASLRA